MLQDSLDSCALVTRTAGFTIPSLFAPHARASERFWEFFTVNIRNRNTRQAYYHAVSQFSVWCEARGIQDLTTVKPLHVATYIEHRLTTASKPTVKQHLAALRALFDWMVVGQTMEMNPASAVRGPKYSVRKGKTPVLSGEQTRELLDSIDGTLVGKRDRALIALMTYTFARVSAAVGMNVEDYYIIGRKGRAKLHEKGGKDHEVPCHRRLDEYLEDYIKSAGIESDPKGPLFRSSTGNAAFLTSARLSPNDAYRMIRRRGSAIGITAKIGNHTFRATGITAYLKNGGRLEIAQQIAAHESSRTTGLYDRRSDEVSLDEIERIVL
jgi:site-specific recombinase XerD